MSPNAWLAALLVLAAPAWPADGGGRSPPDVVERANDRLEKLLAALGEAEALVGCDTQRVYRAAYAPSFAAPVIVTLRLSRTPGTSGAIDVITAGAKGLPSRHGTALTTPQALEIEASLAAIQPETLEDALDRGVDGMSVWGSVCGPGQKRVNFAAWSPEPPARNNAFFRALVALARAVETDETSLFAAETALTYLKKRDELIYADSGGNPRTIRLTGISANEAEPFRELVKSVSQEGGLIVDLRNFSGAGTMFVPELKALDRRKGPTAWVMDRRGWDYLSRTLGVSKKNLVDSMAEAKKRMK